MARTLLGALLLIGCMGAAGAEWVKKDGFLYPINGLPFLGIDQAERARQDGLRLGILGEDLGRAVLTSGRSTFELEHALRELPRSTEVALLKEKEADETCALEGHGVEKLEAGMLHAYRKLTLGNLIYIVQTEEFAYETVLREEVASLKKQLVGLEDSEQASAGEIFTYLKNRFKELSSERDLTLAQAELFEAKIDLASLQDSERFSPQGSLSLQRTYRNARERAIRATLVQIICQLDASRERLMKRNGFLEGLPPVLKAKARIEAFLDLLDRTTGGEETTREDRRLIKEYYEEEPEEGAFLVRLLSNEKVLNQRDLPSLCKDLEYVQRREKRISASITAVEDGLQECNAHEIHVYNHLVWLKRHALDAEQARQDATQLLEEAKAKLRSAQFAAVDDLELQARTKLESFSAQKQWVRELMLAGRQRITDAESFHQGINSKYMKEEEEACDKRRACIAKLFKKKRISFMLSATNRLVEIHELELEVLLLLKELEDQKAARKPLGLTAKRISQLGNPSK